MPDVRDFLAWLFRRRRAYPPDHPIVHSRQLVTEARRRVRQSERLIQRTGNLLGDRLRNGEHR